MKQTSIAPDGVVNVSARFVHAAAAGVREAVVAQFQQVAAQQGMPIAPLTDDLVLLESGLDSLCFAVIVVGLEDALGLDPFSSAEEVYFPVTFGEFVAFYESAAR